MLDPKASYVSSYIRFLKRDKKSQTLKSIFSKSINHFLAKAFLSPITPTMTRLNWQGHLSRFTKNKRTLESSGIFSDDSGDATLPFRVGRRKVQDSQQDSLIQTEFGTRFTCEERRAKDILLFIFTSTPKTRLENLRVLSP